MKNTLLNTEVQSKKHKNSDYFGKYLIQEEVRAKQR